MPEDSEPSGRSLVEALARLGDERIGGAQVFATHTFADVSPRPGSPLHTAVGFGGAVRALTDHVVGLAQVYPRLAVFSGMESHEDRVSPHFHSLYSGLDDDVPAAVDLGRRGIVPTDGSFGARHARELLWRSWFDEHGIARVEAVRGSGSALYVSKYVLKGGDRVPWWRIWEPGELHAEWLRRSRKRKRVRS